MHDDHAVLEPVDGVWSRPAAFPAGNGGLVSTALLSPASVALSPAATPMLDDFAAGAHGAWALLEP